MKKHFPAFLVFVSLVLGCASTETIESTKVPPNEIYQHYSVAATRDETHVSATFRLEAAWGKTVDLDAPARIEHNGREMKEIAPSFMSGTNYKYVSDRFEPAHQFVYTDANGKIYRNELNIEPLEIRGNSFNLSRLEANRIPLTRAVGENEQVNISLASETSPPPTESNANANLNLKNEENHSLYQTAELDKTRGVLIITPDKLKRFVPGKAFINVRIQKEEKPKQRTVKGGAMIFTYESASIPVKVLK